VLLAEVGAGGSGRLFLPVLVALFLLFTPARLWYLSRQPQAGAVVSYIFLLLFATYQVVTGPNTL
jgi:hypothetical protein